MNSRYHTNEKDLKWCTEFLSVNTKEADQMEYSGLVWVQYQRESKEKVQLSLSTAPTHKREYKQVQPSLSIAPTHTEGVQAGTAVPLHNTNTYRGSTSTAPLINLHTRWRWMVSSMPPLLYPWGRNTTTHWTRGWVGPWVSLDVLEMRKVSFPHQRIEPVLIQLIA